MYTRFIMIYTQFHRSNQLPFKIALLRYNLPIEFTLFEIYTTDIFSIFSKLIHLITSFRMFPHSPKKFYPNEQLFSILSSCLSFWWPLIYFVFQLICLFWKFHKNESSNVVFCNCFSFIICFQSSPCYSIFLYLISFNTWIIFHSVNIAHLFIYSFISD